MNIQLKKVKSHMGQDSMSFTAEVWIDGELAGTALNGGSGGENTYYPWQLRVRLDEYARTLPRKVWDAGTASEFSCDMDADLLLDDIMVQMETEKKLKRWCKTKVVFRTPAMPQDEYSVCPGPYTERMKAVILSKHPDAAIVNERFA